MPLFRKGALWLLIATAAVVPPAVFIGLGLDGIFFPLSGLLIVENDSTVKPAQSNVVFQHPGLIMMAIAVTRMHRSFVDFATRTTNM
ncbi:hypothetical protein BC826DRAFT_1011889 [Russula brevipes]|nr:hypothetical protein BC826DRAFT_1011889 [Russula brevipes]